MPLSLRTSCDPASIASAWFRLAGAASLSPTLLAVSVIACAMTVAGCARDPGQHAFTTRHKVGSAPVQTRGTRNYADQRRYAKAQRHWPDAALLSPQPAPDCGFKAGNVEAMDATELARLKIEYERQCYQNAEKAARDRLGLLQGAVQRIRN